jgi:ArsR family transcriptional regulator, arsenate/arsenite/antimonite-responsive transcriptional repressor
MLNAHSAVDVMSVLGQQQRIEIWRALVPVGERGLSAGSLSARLDVAPSSLSFHLQRMSRVGLLTQRNDRRSTIYSANNNVVDALCMFLSVIGATPRASGGPSAAADEVWKVGDYGAAGDTEPGEKVVPKSVPSSDFSRPPKNDY